jgi:phosphatidylglycerophosphate synthase
VIDANIRRLIDPPLARAGQRLAAAGIGADALTIGGCLLGLAAALAVAAGQFYIALALLIANRIADGLDGAIARATRPTDRGAFLDIALDFLVYAAVPLGFAAWSPHANAFAAHFCSRALLPTGVLFWPFPPWPRSAA